MKRNCIPNDNLLDNIGEGIGNDSQGDEQGYQQYQAGRQDLLYILNKKINTCMDSIDRFIVRVINNWKVRLIYIDELLNRLIDIQIYVWID